MEKDWYDKYGKEFHCADCTFLDSCLKKDEPLYSRCCEQYLRDRIAELENQLNNSEQACLICHKDQENEQLKQQLSERERQYEALYKLFSEQHEIIDQNELECFEEVDRLLKEQKDFYVVEKTEYDKMKQGAKDIVNDLKQQLAEKKKEFKWLHQKFAKYVEKNQDKISFAVEKLEKLKEFFLEEHRDEEMDTDYIITKDAGQIADYLLDQIKQLKEGK